MKPGNLRNNPYNAEILDGLNQKPPYMRMSGFATSWPPEHLALTTELATWMPDLHLYYIDTLTVLHSHNPALK